MRRHLFHLSIRRIRTTYILATLVLLSCIAAPFAIYYLTRESSRLGVIDKTKESMPTAQANFDHALAEVKALTQSSLLQEETGKAWIPPVYPECIRNGSILIYVTQQTFQDIMTQYLTAFKSMGWGYSVHLNTEQKSLLNAHNLSETLYLSIEDESYGQYSYLRDDKYPTIYSIHLTYAEPKVEMCYG